MNNFQTRDPASAGIEAEGARVGDRPIGLPDVGNPHFAENVNQLAENRLCDKACPTLEAGDRIARVGSGNCSPMVSLLRAEDASSGGGLQKCPVCGKEFVLEYDHQKFCSRKCSVKHHSLLAKRKRELMKDDPAFIARKRLLNDRRNERRAAARAALLGISVEELMRGRDPHKRGRPRKVQEHEVKPDGNWKEDVLNVLSMTDPTARFEASRKWTDEQRRYARSTYLGMLRDDFSYRRESFC